MNAQLPNPDYANDIEFRWPWWKFDLRPEALFTSLHDRFNTRSSAIQDPQAFHRDVVECADNAATENEFYDRLATRKHERICEINGAWDEISCLLGGTPAIWSCPGFGGHEQDDNAGSDSSASRWRAFVHLCRSMSFDCMVMFFDEYASGERQRQDREREEARRNLDKLCPARRVNTDQSTDDAKLLESTTHSAGTHSELSVNPTSTTAHQPTFDAAKSHPPPHDVEASIPSPLSVSSPSAKTSPNKRERGRSREIVSSTADRTRMSSEDEEEHDVEQIDTDLSCVSKTRRPPSKSGACVPISPDSSHNETVRAEATADCGNNRQQPGSRASSRVLKRSPLQGDMATPPTASSSSAICNNSVFEDPVSPSSATTASPSPRSAKRKGPNNEEGTGDFVSTRQMRKRRRLV